MTFPSFPEVVRRPLARAAAALTVLLCAAGGDVFAAGDDAAGGDAAPLHLVLQERIPFLRQLREDAAALEAAAAEPRNKRFAGAWRGEAKRLNAAAADLEKDAPADIAVRQRVEQWKPAETAIIICDMWDKHWCAHATARVAELAPALNRVIAAARERGVKIIHAPSDTIGFYRNHPARKNAEPFKPQGRNRWNNGLESEKGVQWPVEHTGNGGCPVCKQRRAWSRQIATLEIKDGDFISDNGPQIRAYFEKVGVKNVILTGVHTNMCVIGRPFGLRAMRQAGYNVALMRDMTDLMYNNVAGREQASQGGGRPFVNHFAGLDLMVEYIETHVAPTVLSTDFTGEKQFRFKEDTRRRVAFLAAEGEYQSSRRLAAFARSLLLKHNIAGDFATGRPVMTGPGRHDIHNLQILDDANLAVFAIRRRALAPEKMARVRNYVASGRPVLGFRAAPTSFDAKGNVPATGGGVVAAKNAAPKFLAQWPRFDQEVLGGNYQGHYGHFKQGTTIRAVAGKENHPLLKGVAAEFNSPAWLYINTPLASPRAEVLLTGRDPGYPKNAEQPVLWTNGRKVVNTSLGHWDDWKNPNFTALMENAVLWLLAAEQQQHE
ncbi:MAG: isochorismatase family protein [Puniceicoccales bacterium]|nr:isochorismatase family protein [Puniceicoccales bacterium]